MYLFLLILVVIWYNYDIKYKRCHGLAYFLIKIINSTFTFKSTQSVAVYMMVSPLNGYKFSTNHLIIYLTLLSNPVLITYIFPDKLEIASVIPVYNNLFRNYCHLYNFSQLLEQNVFEQLSSYLRLLTFARPSVWCPTVTCNILCTNIINI